MKYERRLSKNEYIGNGKSLKIARRDGCDFPIHAHDYFEMEIVLSGTGKMRFNGVDYPVSRGTAFILTPSDFHDFRVYERVTLWNISFDETLLTPEHLSALTYGKNCRNLTETELSKVSEAAELLKLESSENGYVKPLIEYILSVVMRDVPQNASEKAIDRAMLYIEAHFRESPSLEETARQACLSAVYFGNLFKKVNGETYISYLNGRKLECAKMLLQNGMSVTEACFASGFGSLSGFLHAFKQRNGITPEQFKLGKSKGNGIQ